MATNTFGAEHFDKVASTYEPRTTNTQLTQMFSELIFLAPPITPTSIIHDNACGPGSITGAIISQHSSSRPEIHATDISPGMISTLRQKPWSAHAESEVMDSQSLTYADETFTHSFMNMGIFLLPDAERGAKEIYRTLKPGGVAIVTSVRYVGWVTIPQAAQKKVRPGDPAWKGLMDPAWSTERKLRDVLQAGGFGEGGIEVKMVDGGQPSEMVGRFFESVREKVTGMITEGWEGEEKERFEVALQEELDEVVRNPRVFELNLWVGVARK